MTRVVHTADVHLHPDHPERYAALEAVLDRATDAETDLVTVGGDLFDSEAAAEALRPDLRETFEDRPFEVLAIPGNHDADAFRDDVFFGPSFRAATDRPFGTATVGDLRVTLLPYTPAPDRELLVALGGREPFDGTEALVLHCSLDAPFADRDAGEETERRYFPVGSATLASLGFDWVLGGHFHGPHQLALDGSGSPAAGGTFVYPGSPASVARSETGRRQVAVGDTGDGSLVLDPLDTFHYDRLALTVLPGEEDAAVERLERWCAERADRDAECRVRVEGHVGLDEATFDDRLADAAGPVPVDNETRSVRELLTHGLYREFETRLDELDPGPVSGVVPAGEAADGATDEKPESEGTPDGDHSQGQGGTSWIVDGMAEDPAEIGPGAVRERVLAVLSTLSARGDLS